MAGLSSVREATKESPAATVISFSCSEKCFTHEPASRNELRKTEQKEDQTCVSPMIIVRVEKDNERIPKGPGTQTCCCSVVGTTTFNGELTGIRGRCERALMPPGQHLLCLGKKGTKQIKPIRSVLLPPPSVNADDHRTRNNDSSGTFGSQRAAVEQFCRSASFL